MRRVAAPLAHAQETPWPLRSEPGRTRGTGTGQCPRLSIGRASRNKPLRRAERRPAPRPWPLPVCSAARGARHSRGALRHRGSHLLITITFMVCCALATAHATCTMTRPACRSWPARHGLMPVSGEQPGIEPTLSGCVPAPHGEIVFLDLETTGLAGGAGTYAFLIGCGWFEAGRVPRSAVLHGGARAQTRPALRGARAARAAAARWSPTTASRST